MAETKPVVSALKHPVPVARKSWVVLALVLKRFVVVAEVVVEKPTFRLVVEALVEKKFVVVALVPVPLTKVKFCKVLEPKTRSPVLVMRNCSVVVPLWRVKKLMDEVPAAKF